MVVQINSGNPQNRKSKPQKCDLSYPHTCSAMVGVPHRPLLPSLPTHLGFGRGLALAGRVHVGMRHTHVTARPPTEADLTSPPLIWPGVWRGGEGKRRVEPVFPLSLASLSRLSLSLAALSRTHRVGPCSDTAPHGGLRSFHQKSTRITRLTIGSIMDTPNDALVSCSGFWIPGFGFRRKTGEDRGGPSRVLDPDFRIQISGTDFGYGFRVRIWGTSAFWVLVRVSISPVGV